jgi:hypothetical protein
MADCIRPTLACCEKSASAARAGGLGRRYSAAVPRSWPGSSAAQPSLDRGELRPAAPERALDHLWADHAPPVDPELALSTAPRPRAIGHFAEPPAPRLGRNDACPAEVRGLCPSQPNGSSVVPILALGHRRHEWGISLLNPYHA